MILREYYGQWYAMWCGQCTTPHCTCGEYDFNDSSGELSYGEVMQQWGEDEFPNLSAQAKRFYRLVLRKYRGEDVDKQITEVADRLARGAAASCLGEARYELSCAVHEVGLRAQPKYLAEQLYRKAPLFKYVTRAGLSSNHMDTSGVARDTFVESQIRSQEGLTPLQAANTARKVFQLHLRMAGTSSGIGGILWWEGADLTYRYLSGKMSAIVYADLMFNAMHNGGSLLNKVFHLGTTLYTVLDIKRNATPEELDAYLSSSDDVRKRIKALAPGYEVSGVDLVEMEKEHDRPVTPSYDKGGEQFTSYGWSPVYGLHHSYVFGKQDYYVMPLPREWVWKAVTRSNNAAYPPAGLAPQLAAFISKEMNISPGGATGKMPSPDKGAKMAAFFEKYPPRPDPDYKSRHGHACTMCDGMIKHWDWPEIPGEEEKCSAGLEDCAHDNCCCCCGEHNGEGHDEWCDNYEEPFECYNGYYDCNCEGEGYCCHEYYNSPHSDHDEGCYNYVEPEEEDDDDGTDAEG